MLRKENCCVQHITDWLHSLLVNEKYDLMMIFFIRFDYKIKIKLILHI